MLMKTSIILFLLLITFLDNGKGFQLKGIEPRRNLQMLRIPSRLQTKNITFQPFVLNGMPADIKDYRFKLSLRMYGKFFCGASAIGSQFALSAAHCLEWNVSPEFINVYGGSSSRVTGGVKFDVQFYELHPLFDSVMLDYDVAVIKIKGSFDLYQNIHTVKLANEQCYTHDGSLVRLAGWGYDENGILPEELHEIQQSILDNSQCYEEWGGDITNRMLCATVEDAEDAVDSCNGDSGGAVLKGCLQVGIISFGSPDCGSSVPSVFTRIEDPDIRQFIRKTTGI